MIDFRCKKCKALLFKEAVMVGTIEVKCGRCNTFNTLEVHRFDNVTVTKENKLDK